MPDFETAVQERMRQLEFEMAVQRRMRQLNQDRVGFIPEPISTTATPPMMKEPEPSAFGSFMQSAVSGATFGAYQDPHAQQFPVASTLGNLAGSALPVGLLSAGAGMIPGLAARAGTGGLIKAMARGATREGIAGTAYGGIRAAADENYGVEDIPQEAAFWAGVGAALPAVGAGARAFANKYIRPRMEQARLEQTADDILGQFNYTQPPNRLIKQRRFDDFIPEEQPTVPKLSDKQMMERYGLPPQKPARPKSAKMSDVQQAQRQVFEDRVKARMAELLNQMEPPRQLPAPPETKLLPYKPEGWDVAGENFVMRSQQPKQEVPEVIRQAVSPEPTAFPIQETPLSGKPKKQRVGQISTEQPKAIPDVKVAEIEARIKKKGFMDVQDAADLKHEKTMAQYRDIERQQAEVRKLLDEAKSDDPTIPNMRVPSGYIEAKRQVGGKYKLFYRGTRNEVFQGQEFNSASEARSFYKTMQAKDVEMNQRPPADSRAGKISTEPPKAAQGATPAQSKQPWEMTREEYQSRARADTKERRVGKNEYAGQHQAPMSDSGSPLSDLTQNATYPEDVYGANGLRYYSSGDAMDSQAYSIIRSARNSPNQSITVYRAVPKSVKGTGDSIIKDGDWVTIVKDYAKEHGEGALNGDYRIVSRVVKARSLFTNGDSWLEWGLDTQPMDAHRTLVGRALKQGKPVPASVLADYPDLAAKYGKGGSVELHAGVNPKQLWEKVPAGIRNIITGAKNRIKTPEGQRVISTMEDAFRERGLLRGKAVERIRETGLRSLSNEEKLNVADVLEGKAATTNEAKRVATKLAVVLRNMHDIATQAGMKIGRLEDYFPRVLKSDIAEMISGDLAKISRKVRDLNMSDKQLMHLFKEWARNEQGLSRATKAAIEHARKQGKDIGKFVYTLWNMHRKRGFTLPFGNLEESRLLDLPSNFYERNPGIVLGEYADGWAKRVAETKFFGQDASKLTDQLKAIAEKGNPDSEELRKIAKVFTGVADVENALSPNAAKWVRRGTNLAVTTKIGTGFANILQTTQPLISMIPKAGVLRTIQGGIKLLDPSVRKMVRETGAAPFADAVESLTGQHLTGSVSGKIANAVTTASGFKGANEALQYLAASTGDIWVKDLYKSARGGGKRAAWAQKWLRTVGVDYTKPLTTEVRQKAMFQFAMDSQLQRNVLRDPVWMNNPQLRPFALFKRFGVRQAEYIKNDIIKEAADGNVLPILRIAAGGYLGGEFIGWAKNEITEILTGEKQERFDEPLTFDRLINNLANVGALGMVSDLLKTDEVTPWKKFSDRAASLGFAMTPAIGSEVRQTFMGEGDRPSLIRQFADQADRRGAAGAFVRLFPNMAAMVSPIGGRAAKRLQSNEQVDNRWSYNKGKETARIAYLLVNNDKDEALRRLRLWNETYPKHAINGDAIRNAIENLIKSNL